VNQLKALTNKDCVLSKKILLQLKRISKDLYERSRNLPFKFSHPQNRVKQVREDGSLVMMHKEFKLKDIVEIIRNRCRNVARNPRIKSYYLITEKFGKQIKCLPGSYIQEKVRGQ
jgi:hypothetical protein